MKLRIRLSLLTVDDVSETGEYPGWRTLFRLAARKDGGKYTVLAVRFRGWKPFAVFGSQGHEHAWPKWQPRPWDKEVASA